MKTLSTLLLLLLFSAPVSGEIFSPQAETLFQRALSDYNQNKISDARDGFIELIEQHPPNQRTSAARFMLAKSHYKLKAYNLALTEAIALQHHYPRSRYISETDLIIGDCYFYQHQIYNAATQYARVLTSRADIRTKARAADRLGQLSGSEKLPDSEVENLKTDFNRAIIDEAIAFGKAHWHIKLGDLEKGNKHLTLFLNHHPTGQFAALTRQILLSARAAPNPQPPVRSPQPARYKIGVIAPLGTPSGEDLRNGITLARDRNPLARPSRTDI